MSDEEAVAVMEHTIGFYAQRLHQRFQGYLVPWSVEDLQQEGRLTATLNRRVVHCRCLPVPDAPCCVRCLCLVEIAAAGMAYAALGTLEED